VLNFNLSRGNRLSFRNQLHIISATTVQSPRLPFWYLLLVCFYTLPGLLGRDPWKPDEGYVFGIVYHMFQTGDWVVPTLAGEPFMEKPPVFYWVATITAYVMQAWLPLHNGARLACAVFVAMTLAGIHAAFRVEFVARASDSVELLQIDVDRGAVLAAVALLGCLGFVVHSHMMMPDLPQLAGFTIAIAGLLQARTQSVKGGFWLGFGAGLGFLSKGLLAPALIGASALALPILFSQWRTRAYFRAWGVAGLSALPWLLVWPLALYQRDEHLLREWLWVNNFGRFFGFTHLGAENEPWFWTRTLPWFAFPALPIAVIWLARHFRQVMISPLLQISVVLFSITLAVLAGSASSRAVYGLVFLPPICLVAGIACAHKNLMRSHVWLTWLAGLTFVLLSALTLLKFIIALFTGEFRAIGPLARHLPKDFTVSFTFAHLFSVAIMIVAAMLLFYLLRQSLRQGVVMWAAAIALFWATLNTAWLPWINAARSYRAPMSQIAAVIGPQADCVESMALGESERAMLHYFPR
jgi:4-amino-4-deoxy-L-arabinose transferase-like glycosyltransferase